ncbi:Proline iminopeptidase [Pseudoalteromonas luteoviolacea B = ATCC 29581]|nr:Proline iminopeptidase [Pseudoalteromonas luteoviolacea B = ATCC 29581]
MTQLYDYRQANRHYHFAVGDGHQIEVEEWGAATGIPVFVCHGGPGIGLNSSMVQFFNPLRYRVILFSQRGSGNSTPHSLEHNQTDTLLEDIDKLRRHLGLQNVVLCGGSWGATLAMAYAVTYPKYVAGLLLWSSFLSGNDDFEWFCGPSGAGAQFYPEAYQQLNEDGLSWQGLIARYYLAVKSHDELHAYQHARRWLGWESLLASGSERGGLNLIDKQHTLNCAKIMLHYFSHRCFLSHGFFEEQIKTLAPIPTWFIHGRHDAVCRFSAVQQFAEKVNAQLFILEGVGHSLQNGVYCSAIRRAADLLLIKLDH